MEVIETEGAGQRKEERFITRLTGSEREARGGVTEQQTAVCVRCQFGESSTG